METDLRKPQIATPAVQNKVIVQSTKLPILQENFMCQANEPVKLSYAIASFPEEVQLCVSSIPGAGCGVCAKQHIPVGTWIGPYEGKLVKCDEIKPTTDTSYMWEIYQEGKLSHYLDASDENTSSWMRFIRCARYREEQNLFSFQYCGNIYYRAFREISVGAELLVWYDEKYPQDMGIPLEVQDMALVDPNGTRLLQEVLAAQGQIQPTDKLKTTSQFPVPVSTQPAVTMLQLNRLHVSHQEQVTTWRDLHPPQQKILIYHGTTRLQFPWPLTVL